MVTVETGFKESLKTRVHEKQFSYSISFPLYFTSLHSLSCHLCKLVLWSDECEKGGFILEQQRGRWSESRQTSEEFQVGIETKKKKKPWQELSGYSKNKNVWDAGRKWDLSDTKHYNYSALPPKAV